MKRVLKLPILLILISNLSMADFNVLVSEYPPYIMKSGKGLLLEIVSRSFELENKKLNFSYIPIKRSRATFLNEKGGMFIFTRHSMEPNEFAHAEYREIAAYQNYFLSLSNDTEKFKPQNLSNLHFGKYVGSTLEDKLVKSLNMKNVRPLVTYRSKILALVQKSVEAVFCVNHECKLLIQLYKESGGADKLYTHKLMGSFAEGDIYYNKKFETPKKIEFIKTFGRGFKQLKDRGELEEIYKKYDSVSNPPFVVKIKKAP